ncbi:MAG: PIN domain-containing protein [Desulfobacterales bacterium]
MKFIDTNIFIRFLTNDIPEKADVCEHLFREAAANNETLFTTEMVIAEIIWVLESYYERPRKEVREMVEKILITPFLFCPQKDLILNALILYDDKNIDYIDAYNASILRELKIKEVYSYDRHYDKIEWVRRIEP